MKSKGVKLGKIAMTACACGWNGKVDWRAHGQKCPNCGELLT